jgi:hypothetical protein
MRFIPCLFLSLLFSIRVGSVQSLPQQNQLSARQEIESLFQNAVRNSQKSNDVFMQVRILKNALHDITNLQNAFPAMDGNEQRKIKKRITQLKRMIAKENPVETL